LTADFRYSAILVDGIHGSIQGPGASFKAELKNYWRGVTARHSKGENDWVATKVKFAMLKVLDGTHSIQDVSDVLKRRLQELDPNQNRPRPSESHDSQDSSADAQNNVPAAHRPSDDSPATCNYVLLGFGLGCAVIRNLLAQEYSNEWGLRTVGVIFMNDMSSDVEGIGRLSDNHYLERVRQWKSRYCSRGRASQGSLEALSKELQRVDGDYKAAMIDGQQREARPIREYFLAIDERSSVSTVLKSGILIPWLSAKLNRIMVFSVSS
jgi:hypothetical protein